MRPPRHKAGYRTTRKAILASSLTGHDIRRPQHSTAYRTTRKTTRDSSPIGHHTRPRRNVACRIPHKTILGNSPTGLRIRRPRRNAACRTTRKAILTSSLTGLRIQARHNTLTWRARRRVRRTIRTLNPVPRTARAPRTLHRWLRAASMRPHNNMRLRRTPAVPLRHSLQVGLVSKAFRSDPLRKISRTMTHPLPAATTEGITVAAADG